MNSTHLRINRVAAPDAHRAGAGISNRESAAEEARERTAHPPVDDEPMPEDASGRQGDAAGTDLGGQTSHKAGSRSIAQKEAGTRYPDRSMPPSRKVDGAFGEEPHNRSEAGGQSEAAGDESVKSPQANERRKKDFDELIDGA
jgi:hypothetical protein